MGKPRSEGGSWKKLGDSVGARIFAMVVIAIGAWWAYVAWDQKPESHETSPRLVTSLEGVRIGDKLAAIASSHGPFDREVTPAHVVKKHAGEEDYRQRNGQLRLSVRDGVVRSIAYACKQGHDPTALNHVACHDFEDRIRRVFGERLRVLCAKVKPEDPNQDIASHVRAYDALEHGTRYIVIKDEVQGFMVMEAKELESLVGFNWLKCG